MSVVLLSITTPHPTTLAATRDGSPCSNAGGHIRTNGVTYRCVKIGKKLRWRRVVPVQRTPIAVWPTSPISDSSQFLNLDACRIRDEDPALTNMTAGFPIPFGRIDLTRGANVQIIGVDFADKPGGTDTPQQVHQQNTQAIENFWSAQSTVPTNFTWSWNPEWVRLPGSINSYGLGGSFFEGKFNPPAYFGLAENIIRQTDDSINYGGTNLLIIVFPPRVTNSEIGTFLVHTQGSYRTNEGSIFNLIIAGGDYATPETYIHEFGHALGLTDIRDTTQLNNQKSDGMFYDIMNNPNVPELLVWHRFLLGFLESSQIHCITSTEPSTHVLSPVAASTKKLKGLVIPLTSSEAIIVELRRALGFDSVLTSRDFLVGAVVYTLDTRIPYRKSPVKVEQVLKLNQSVSVRGYKISVVESGPLGDVVKVEKSE